jgi:hypothetical protein
VGRPQPHLPLRPPNRSRTPASLLHPDIVKLVLASHDKPSVVAFAGWMTVGVFVLIALLAGVILLAAIALALAAIGLAALLIWPRGRSTAAFGVLSGAGVVPLYVAWLNRRGPGEICNATLTASHCVEEWNPWGWLIFGILLVVSGVAGFALSRRSSGQSGGGTVSSEPEHQTGCE